MIAASNATKEKAQVRCLIKFYLQLLLIASTKAIRCQSIVVTYRCLIVPFAVSCFNLFLTKGIALALLYIVFSSEISRLLQNLKVGEVNA